MNRCVKNPCYYLPSQLARPSSRLRGNTSARRPASTCGSISAQWVAVGLAERDLDLCLRVAESGSEIADVGMNLRGKGGGEECGGHAGACGAGGKCDVRRMMPGNPKCKPVRHCQSRQRDAGSATTLTRHVTRLQLLVMIMNTSSTVQAAAAADHQQLITAKLHHRMPVGQAAAVH